MIVVYHIHVWILCYDKRYPFNGPLLCTALYGMVGYLSTLSPTYYRTVEFSTHKTVSVFSLSRLRLFYWHLSSFLRPEGPSFARLWNNQIRPFPLPTSMIVLVITLPLTTLYYYRYKYVITAWSFRSLANFTTRSFLRTQDCFLNSFFLLAENLSGFE